MKKEWTSAVIEELSVAKTEKNSPEEKYWNDNKFNIGDLNGDGIINSKDKKIFLNSDMYGNLNS